MISRYLGSVTFLSSETGFMFFVSSVIMSKVKIIINKILTFKPVYKMFDKKFLLLILLLVSDFNFLFKCFFILLCCF